MCEAVIKKGGSVLFAPLLLCLSLMAACGNRGSSSPGILLIDAEAAIAACEYHATEIADVSKARIADLDASKIANAEFTIWLAELDSGASHSRIELTVSDLSRKTEAGWSVLLRGRWMRPDGANWAGLFEYFVSEGTYEVEWQGAAGYEDEFRSL